MLFVPFEKILHFDRIYYITKNTALRYIPPHRVKSEENELNLKKNTHNGKWRLLSYCDAKMFILSSKVGLISKFFQRIQLKKPKKHLALFIQNLRCIPVEKTQST